MIQKIFLLALICGVLACQKEKEQAAIDEQKIQDFLADAGWNTIQHQSGFHYTMLQIDSSCAGNCTNTCSSQCGDGCFRACEYSIVEFTYVVYDIDSLLMGDSTPILSKLDTSSFQYVSDMIPAVQLALTEIEEFTLGASGFLLIPSGLAYKHKGLSDIIKPDATLLMYLNLIESHPHF